MGRTTPGWAAVTLSGRTGSLWCPCAAKEGPLAAHSLGLGSELLQSQSREASAGLRGCLGLASVGREPSCKGPTRLAGHPFVPPWLFFPGFVLMWGAFLAKVHMPSVGVGAAPPRVTCPPRTPCVWLGGSGIPGPGESVSCRGSRPAGEAEVLKGGRVSGQAFRMKPFPVVWAHQLLFRGGQDV